LGAELDELASLLSGLMPGFADDQRIPTREGLLRARTEWERVHGKMIALQEELDWEVYHAYGLIPDEDAAQLIADPAIVPEIKLGERAFEIALGRRMREEDFQTEWFARHRSRPITEVPAHALESYLSGQLETLGLTEQALASWTAPPVRRGRPPKKRPSGVRSTRTDRW
jgi:hypothetical protein